MEVAPDGDFVVAGAVNDSDAATVKTELAKVVFVAMLALVVEEVAKKVVETSLWTLGAEREALLDLPYKGLDFETLISYY